MESVRVPELSVMLTFAWKPSDSAEMRIPRRDDGAFREHFADGVPRPHIRYVYRCDHLNRKVAHSVATYGPPGHRYRASLPDIQRKAETYREYPLLGQIAAHAASIVDPLALYFFSIFEGAATMQLANLNATYDLVVDQTGAFSSPMYRDPPLRSVTIISRIAIENLPAGRFFPDPLPQDSPLGVVHVVASKTVPLVVLPMISLEFLLDERWVPGAEVNFSEVADRVVRERTVRHLLPASSLPGERA